MTQITEVLHFKSDTTIACKFNSADILIRLRGLDVHYLCLRYSGSHLQSVPKKQLSLQQLCLITPVQSVQHDMSQWVVNPLEYILTVPAFSCYGIGRATFLPPECLGPSEYPVAPSPSLLLSLAPWVSL